MPKLIREPQPPRVPALVLGLLDPPKGEKRGPPGVGGGQATRDMLRDLLFEVEVELLVELVLSAAPEHERPHLSDNEIPESHDTLLKNL
jgi:hypothetical protein